jgi:acetyltransferase-like isoleucine patch superfamily enzyme
MSGLSRTKTANIRISFHEKSLIHWTVIYTGNGVRLGKHVLVAANCTFAPVNHEYKTKEQLIINQRFAPRDGIHIAEGSLIAMSASIVKDTEPWGVYEGSPATKGGVLSKDMDFLR